MTEEENYSLLRHNTFGIEAFAERFITYDSVDDLKATVAHICSSYPDMPVLHIGGGSNLLFLSNFKGIVLHSSIRSIDVERKEGMIRLRVGAGVVWDDLVSYCVEHGYYGIENLTSVPGEVGAAAVQNIGAYGAEIKDVVTGVETIDLTDGTERFFEAADCGYAYRHSVFKTSLCGRYAVTYVHLLLSPSFRPNLDYGGVREALRRAGIAPEKATAEDVRRVIADIRHTKLPDPQVSGNAGSFFKNPVVERSVYERIRADYPDAPHYEADAGRVKLSAGWLIERCGWKGRSLGRAGVHNRQALVLVNLGGATGQDILALCEAVRGDVYRAFGIYLQPEVNFIGGESC